MDRVTLPLAMTCAYPYRLMAFSPPRARQPGESQQPGESPTPARHFHTSVELTEQQPDKSAPAATDALLHKLFLTVMQSGTRVKCEVVLCF